MIFHPPYRGLLLSLVAVAALLAGRDVARAQSNDSTDLSIELVDPKVRAKPLAAGTSLMSDWPPRSTRRRRR